MERTKHGLHRSIVKFSARLSSHISVFDGPQSCHSSMMMWSLLWWIYPSAWFQLLRVNIAKKAAIKRAIRPMKNNARDEMPLCSAFPLCSLFYSILNHLFLQLCLFSNCHFSQSIQWNKDDFSAKHLSSCSSTGWTNRHRTITSRNFDTCLSRVIFIR